jgi:hypothetical protein
MHGETALKRWGSLRVRFLCGKCWKRLTKAERRVFYRIERLEKRLGVSFGDRKHRVFDALIRRAGS